MSKRSFTSLAPAQNSDSTEQEDQWVRQALTHLAKNPETWFFIIGVLRLHIQPHREDTNKVKVKDLAAEDLGPSPVCWNWATLLGWF